jgi:hypothetical protein
MPDGETVDFSKYQNPDGALDLGAVVADLDRVAELQAGRKPEPEFSVAWLCGRHPLLGGEYYRGLRPAALLNRRYDWHTAVCNTMGTEDDKPDGPLFFVTLNGHVITPRVIVIRPIREWTAYWTERAQRNGQVVLVDLDDDIWAHENFEENIRLSDDHYEEWCWKADGWLVSVPQIRRRVLQLGREHWKHAPPVVVAPNCYDPVGVGGGLLPRPGRRLGNRLWLSGRMSADLELWRTLVAPLLEELDLTFVHVGDSTDPIEYGPQEGKLPPSFVADCGFPPSRTILRPQAALPEMHKSFSDVSIGVIVQADHPFNVAKTETNAVELASMGLPLVAATNHILYRTVPGRVSPDPTSVRGRIQELLDPVVWEEESQRARAWATEVAVKREGEYLAAFTDLLGVVLHSV